MQLIPKSVEVHGTYAQLIRQANPGDQILLHEGLWDGWRSHPKGVVIRVGQKLLLVVA